jgi:F-type H+-transporting ATPase subunit c
MKRIFLLAVIAALFLPGAAALAQDTTLLIPETDEGRTAFVDGSLGKGLGVLGLGLGLGLLMYGAAMGIGNIGGRAAESIARQPEAGGRIFTTMIISAALIEGATLFAIVAVIIK